MRACSRGRMMSDERGTWSGQRKGTADAVLPNLPESCPEDQFARASLGLIKPTRAVQISILDHEGRSGISHITCAEHLGSKRIEFRLTCSQTQRPAFHRLSKHPTYLGSH